MIQTPCKNPPHHFQFHPTHYTDAVAMLNSRAIPRRCQCQRPCLAMQVRCSKTLPARLLESQSW